MRNAIQVAAPGGVTSYLNSALFSFHLLVFCFDVRSVFGACSPGRAPEFKLTWRTPPEIRQHLAAVRFYRSVLTNALAWALPARQRKYSAAKNQNIKRIRKRKEHDGRVPFKASGVARFARHSRPPNQLVCFSLFRKKKFKYKEKHYNSPLKR